jgi:hypothetical protein
MSRIGGSGRGSSETPVLPPARGPKDRSVMTAGLAVVPFGGATALPPSSPSRPVSSPEGRVVLAPVRRVAAAAGPRLILRCCVCYSACLRGWWCSTCESISSTTYASLPFC